MDTIDFILDDVTIAYCNDYTYLGTPLSKNSIVDQVKHHLKRKVSHAWTMIPCDKIYLIFK